MNLYRCAACGSSKVFTEEKSEGYSIAKGAIGTALFGTGGAVMGVNGKSNVYYHCAECGQTLSYTMPESVKKAIDDAIANPEIYITFLKSQKEHYPNIEWNESIENYKKKELYEYTAEEQADLIWNYYQKSRIAYIEEEELLKALGFKDEFLDIKTREILKKKGLIKLEVKNDKFYYTFFENPEDIRNNIDELERNEQIKQQFDEVWKENREKLKNAIIELLTKINSENISNEFEYEFLDIKIKELAQEFIKFEDYNSLLDYDKLLNKMVSNVFFILYYNKYIKPSNKEGFYRILTDKERKDIIANQEGEREKKIEEEQKECLNEIKKILANNKKMTLTQMKENSSLLDTMSFQKLSYYCKKWCDKGELEKTIDDCSSFYALPGTKKLLEDRYNKEVEKNNANINNKIADIYKEIKKENEIIEINKYKFFGDGAKAKSEAKVRITKLEEEIRNLKSQLKEKK